MTPILQIAAIADVPVDVEVVLDRRMLKISEILELNSGSVIEMRRSAGENIDVYVGRKLVAFGEIVIIENTMGVRITDFSSDD
ncbi:MAG: FliM/FliN family flagellar motor switch protein [Acidobacteriota bacterium]|nr:FliM/FliN family flagellar motor switch protein [Acidobacteriota bacterium]